MQNGCGGYGGLLRNDEGNPIVGYAGTSNNLHVLWLEMFSLYRGLVIAIERGAGNLCIYMDSQLGVDIIRNVIRCPWRVLSIKRRIEGSLQRLTNVRIQHVWREAD